MPNANYAAGRRFEQECARFYRNQGCHVIRAAASKGLFDLVVMAPMGTWIHLIQCKVVANIATKNALMARWVERPPFLSYNLPKGVHQILEVKVKGDTTVYRSTLT